MGTDGVGALDRLGVHEALAIGSRPAASRTAARNASWMRSVRPSSVQVLKYQYTVSHGGKSCGSWRHEQPVPVQIQDRVHDPTARTGRRAPPGRGSTIGAISSHYASVRSDGYDSGSHAHIVNHIDHISHISHAGAPPAFKHVLRDSVPCVITGTRHSTAQASALTLRVIRLSLERLAGQRGTPTRRCCAVRTDPSLASIHGLIDGCAGVDMRKVPSELG